MKAIEMPPLLRPTDLGYDLETYSVDQAARYLLIDVTRIYRDVAAHRIGFRRDGKRRVRFSQADLDAWRLRMGAAIRSR